LHGQLAQNLCSSWPKGYPPTPRGTWGNFGETKNLKKKTVLSLTLVQLCVETREALIYRAHRTVIFAIAQLSCLYYPDIYV